MLASRLCLMFLLGVATAEFDGLSGGRLVRREAKAKTSSLTAGEITSDASMVMVATKEAGEAFADVAQEGRTEKKNFPLTSWNYVDGTIPSASSGWNGTYDTEAEVQADCDADAACKGYFRKENQRFYLVNEYGSTTWSAGQPSDVVSVKVATAPACFTNKQYDPSQRSSTGIGKQDDYQACQAECLATHAANQIFTYWPGPGGCACGTQQSGEPAQACENQQGQAFSCTSGSIHCVVQAVCMGDILAKDANLNGAIIISDYVDFQNSNGDFIEWHLTGCSEGAYRADFIYALGTYDRPLQLLVNGASVVSSLSFPSTGDWNTYLTVTHEVSLNAGSNTIKLLAIGYSGGNFLKLTLTQA